MKIKLLVEMIFVSQTVCFAVFQMNCKTLCKTQFDHIAIKRNLHETPIKFITFVNKQEVIPITS